MKRSAGSGPAATCADGKGPTCSDAALWTAAPQDYAPKATTAGVPAAENEDIAPSGN